MPLAKEGEVYPSLGSKTDPRDKKTSGPVIDTSLNLTPQPGLQDTLMRLVQKRVVSPHA